MRVLRALAALALVGCPLHDMPLAPAGSGTSPDGGAASSDGGADDGGADDGEDAATDADGGPDGGSTEDDGGVVVPPASCADVAKDAPGSPSGLYRIVPPDGVEVEVFCDMDRLGGGWTRAAVVDTTVDACPGEWVTADPPLVCTRPTSGGGSQASATFPSPQGPYDQVMGFVSGLQYGSMDTFAPYHNDSRRGLMDTYVDGVSITTLEAAPQHVWTYAVAWSDDDNRETSLCPCLGGNPSPPFIGEDFYCESGTTGTSWDAGWLVDDPLWDGDGRGSNCDTPASPSLFLRDLPEQTDVPLQVRLMADQGSSNEDVGLSRLELYVR